MKRTSFAYFHITYSKNPYLPRSSYQEFADHPESFLLLVQVHLVASLVRGQPSSISLIPSNCSWISNRNDSIKGSSSIARQNLLYTYLRCLLNIFPVMDLNAQNHTRSRIISINAVSLRSLVKLSTNGKNRSLSAFPYSSSNNSSSTSSRNNCAFC